MVEEEKLKDNVRMWTNCKTPIIEIPDGLIKQILGNDALGRHTYSINSIKECMIIQKVPNHGKGRDCHIIYASGHVSFIPAEDYKTKNDRK